MCGILGAAGDVPSIAASVFGQALDTLAHRGPDAQSVWSGASVRLGHRRLAVVDLSDAGVQPMVDPDTGLVITFNGEIYNYVELRAALISKGHRFRSGSDTEVLLKGFAEWGAGVLERCNGMWAFAVWNPKTETLFLARDRFGKKPLYYTTSNKRLLFASEPKALHALDASLAVAEPKAVIELIVNSRLHAGERTFFRDIRALPAAHFATYTVHDCRFKLQRYWDYPAADTDVSKSGSVKSGESKTDNEQFADLLDDAVRLRLRSDVPVGLTLSGGLDSSAILAAVRKGGQSLASYTSVFSAQQRGEEHWAEIAAQYAGSTVMPVETSVATWWETLGKIVHQMDGPGFSPAVLPQWQIMARARFDKVPVLLEGQGADEVLAGYTQHSALQALGQFKRGHFGGGLQTMRQMGRSFSLKWSAAWLARQAFPGLAGRATRDLRLPFFHPEHLADWRQQPVDATLSMAGQAYDPLRARLWRDHAIDVLPSLLHYGDAISMAHGIESRLPFMDHRIVEWVFRDKPALLQDGRSKSLVRSYLKSQGFDKIANRQDKLGYVVPILEWYKNVGAQHLERTLADPAAPIWDMLRRSEIETLSTASKGGSTTGIFHLYKVLTTDIWLRELKVRATMPSRDHGVHTATVRPPSIAV
jgi:asparagine synthase (glutamine-hydrolysing)